MSNQIKISVVIPVYNSENTLKRCLEYVVHQTYQNLEIIIVDDGSTDNSESIYTEYLKQDKRIKIIKQKNSGPANARNNGLENATGDYVHFHDSDDYAELDYYSKFAQTAETTKADIICGEVEEIGYNFPRFDKVEILTSLDEKIQVTQANKFNVVWRYIYKRDFLKKHGLKYPLNMFIGEDKVFMNQTTYYASSIATAPGAKYNCLSNPTSLGKNPIKVMKGRPNGDNKALAEYKKFMDHSGMNAAIQKANRAVFQKSKKLEFIKIPVFTKKYFSNNIIQFRILNIPVVKKHITSTKTRYYIFGLYLFRTYETV